MKKTVKKLTIRREQVRLVGDLRGVAGAIPTGFGTVPCVLLEARGTTSENDPNGGGLCPSEHPCTHTD